MVSFEESAIADDDTLASKSDVGIHLRQGYGGTRQETWPRRIYALDAMPESPPFSRTALGL